MEVFFAVWTSFFEESLGSVSWWKWGKVRDWGFEEEHEGRTFSVMTTEQSMQARRLRC